MNTYNTSHSMSFEGDVLNYLALGNLEYLGEDPLQAEESRFHRPQTARSLRDKWNVTVSYLLKMASTSRAE